MLVNRCGTRPSQSSWPSLQRPGNDAHAGSGGSSSTSSSGVTPARPWGPDACASPVRSTTRSSASLVSARVRAGYFRRHSTNLVEVLACDERLGPLGCPVLLWVEQQDGLEFAEQPTLIDRTGAARRYRAGQQEAQHARGCEARPTHPRSMPKAAYGDARGRVFQRPRGDQRCRADRRTASIKDGRRNSGRARPGTTGR